MKQYQIRYIIQESSDGVLWKDIADCMSEEEAMADIKELEQNAKKVAGHWNNYIEYLKDWARQHEELEFEGMTPVSYDEFLDNESEEL